MLSPIWLNFAALRVLLSIAYVTADSGYVIVWLSINNLVHKMHFSLHD